MKLIPLEFLVCTIVWILVWKGWHTSHPCLVVGLQVPKGMEVCVATTQWDHSISFMATVILLIKLVLVLLRSCGRAMFCIVVWLGFSTVVNSIFPSGFNTDLVYF